MKIGPLLKKNRAAHQDRFLRDSSKNKFLIKNDYSSIKTNSKTFVIHIAIHLNIFYTICSDLKL